MALTTYYAEDQNPGTSITAGPLAKRNALLAVLSGTVDSYGFENKTVGNTAPFSFTLANSGGNMVVTVGGSGSVGSVGGGMFPTTGSSFWKAQQQNAFTLDFATPVAAFGCYLTNARANNDNLLVTLTPTNGDPDFSFQISNVVSSGTLFFVGFVDNNRTYSRVTFFSPAGVTSLYGTDDILAVGSNQVTPIAEPNTFLGINTATPSTVTGAPVSARAAFLAALTPSISNYGFEDKINGDKLPFSASFVNSITSQTTVVTMTTTSTLYTPTVKNAAGSGRFNTTSGGFCYLQVSAELTPKSLVLTPSRLIAAMGFYISDVADFNGGFNVKLTESGGATNTITVINCTGGLTMPNGNLFFWGFADPSKTYSKVEIICPGPSDTVGSFDYFGFDDFVIAETTQLLGGKKMQMIFSECG